MYDIRVQGANRPGQTGDGPPVEGLLQAHQHSGGDIGEDRLADERAAAAGAQQDRPKPRAIEVTPGGEREALGAALVEIKLSEGNGAWLAHGG